jgi:hypothetical protein
LLARLGVGDVSFSRLFIVHCRGGVALSLEFREGEAIPQYWGDIHQ